MDKLPDTDHVRFVAHDTEGTDMTIEYHRKRPTPPPQLPLDGITIRHDNGHLVRAFMRPDGVGLDESMATSEAYTAIDLSVVEAKALGNALLQLAAQVPSGR